MKKNKFLLEEGSRSVWYTFVLSLVFFIFISECLGYITFALMIGFVYMYRNPSRHIFRNTQSILAPIDGVVRAVDRVDGKVRIYTEVSICNTHSVRAPKDASMQIVKQLHGLHFSPSSYKALQYNEQVLLQFGDVELHLISGFFNTRIDNIGEKDVLQGEKISVFLQGMAVITLDEKYNSLVGIGDKIISGQTVLFKQ